MAQNNSKTHWQQVYRQKAATDVSWFQAEPTVSLELIHRCRLQPDDPIINVGGGASVLVDFLLGEGYTAVTVLDISAIALAESELRLGCLAERVEWIEADITAYEPPHQFALWHDRAVFHFLTESADRHFYVSTLRKALRPGGHLIIASFAIGGPERCSGLEIVQYDADRLQAELGPEFRLEEVRPHTHITPRGQEQAFVYFRFVRGALGAGYD